MLETIRQEERDKRDELGKLAEILTEYIKTDDQAGFLKQLEKFVSPFSEAYLIELAETYPEINSKKKLTPYQDTDWLISLLIAAKRGKLNITSSLLQLPREAVSVEIKELDWDNVVQQDSIITLKDRDGNFVFVVFNVKDNNKTLAQLVCEAVVNLKTAGRKQFGPEEDATALVNLDSQKIDINNIKNYAVLQSWDKNQIIVKLSALKAATQDIKTEFSSTVAIPDNATPNSAPENEKGKQKPSWLYHRVLVSIANKRKKAEWKEVWRKIKSGKESESEIAAFLTTLGQKGRKWAEEAIASLRTKHMTAKSRRVKIEDPPKMKLKNFQIRLTKYLQGLQTNNRERGSKRNNVSAKVLIWLLFNNYYKIPKPDNFHIPPAINGDYTQDFTKEGLLTNIKAFLTEEDYKRLRELIAESEQLITSLNKEKYNTVSAE